MVLLPFLRKEGRTMARKAAGISEAKGGLLCSRFTVNGKRYAVYGKTLKECRDKELQKRQEIEEGRYHTGKEQTIDEYFRYWIEKKRGTVKETTLCTEQRWYKTISAVRIDSAGTTFGSLKLCKVEPQNIVALQKELVQTHTTNGTNSYVTLINSLFRSAVTDRIIVFNPCAGVKSLKRTEKKAVETIHRALTREETAAFLNAAAESWYYNLFVFLLNTGLRIGEAGAITRADITEKGLNVRRTLTKNETGGREIGKDTKTPAGKRFVPLNQDARDAITRQQDLTAKLNGDKVVDITGRIFTSEEDKLLSSPAVNGCIARICARAGIEKFTAHAFRDTFATRCVEAGMNPKTLQAIMGHSNISITMNLYAHCEDSTKERELLAVKFG